MTTLYNTTIKNIIEKTSFEKDSLRAKLLITCMGCGFSFIKSFKMAKQLTK
jgi:hypothetical protein